MGYYNTRMKQISKNPNIYQFQRCVTIVIISTLSALYRQSKFK